MTLEEKLHELAAKGELVHISLAATSTGYLAVWAAASPANGYAMGTDRDPVRALTQALETPIIKTRRVRTKSVEADTTDGEVTVGVKPERAAKLRSYM